MNKLTIKEIERHGGLRTMRIGGFEPGEMSALKGMKHLEAKDKVLDLLDERNNGTGTAWHNGYGAYGCWFDNEFAYMNIGISCD